ncbi:hypothetical protein C0Q70_10727 [Pomacea canaliculata]|uniref:Uncharacterized protein n=1 Tax=Pomacea canaliculata TaxID=400727 RepID=A0A2T7P3Z0_POMCA|nr:hypothetical protein C0Q70_10727 [Pomacea canaliculata]
MSRAVQETGTSPSQELHTGRRSLPMSVDVDIQKSIDVFDLHLGDIVVTSITQYEEPSDQSPPSTAEGVVAAVEALPATVKVREAPGINQSSSPLTVLVEPRHRSRKVFYLRLSLLLILPIGTTTSTASTTSSSPPPQPPPIPIAMLQLRNKSRQNVTPPPLPKSPPDS